MGPVVDEREMFNRLILEDTKSGIEGDISLIDFELNFYQNFLKINSNLSSKVFQVMKGDFNKIYSSLNPRSYSLIIVDTSHGFNETLLTIKNAINLLAPGGIIAGDDYNWVEINMAVNFLFDTHKISSIRCNSEYCKELREPHSFWMVKP